MSLPHSEKLTLPYVALLTTIDVWKVSMKQSSDPEFSSINTKPNTWGTHPAIDAFEVCSEFLALQTPHEALHFFERYGPFQLQPQMSADPRRWKALRIRWSAIQRAQSDFLSARMSPEINFKDPVHLFVFQPLLGVELHFRGVQVPEREYSKDDDPEDPSPSVVLSPRKGSEPSLSDAAIVNCEDIVTAVRASIFLRRMNGFTWRRCARKGCEKVFEVSAGWGKKIYHSWACGHLVAVKKSKAKKKKEAKEAKSKKKGRK
jgi:hypothetical protein